MYLKYKEMNWLSTEGGLEDLKEIINIIMIFAILTSVFIFFIPTILVIKILVIAITIVVMILNYTSNRIE